MADDAGIDPDHIGRFHAKVETFSFRESINLARMSGFNLLPIPTRLSGCSSLIVTCSMASLGGSPVLICSVPISEGVSILSPKTSLSKIKLSLNRSWKIDKYRINTSRDLFANMKILRQSTILEASIGHVKQHECRPTPMECRSS